VRAKGGFLAVWARKTRRLGSTAGPGFGHQTQFLRAPLRKHPYCLHPYRDRVLRIIAPMGWAQGRSW